MKKLLDGLYVVLGTLCLFGLPSAALGLTAWFGDSMMGALHTSASAVHTLSFQLEAMAIIFGTSIGGLAAAMGLFTALWLGARMINRAAEAMEVLPTPAPGRIRFEEEAVVVGRLQHAGSQRRRQQTG
jgi:hypothetical protein